MSRSVKPLSAEDAASTADIISALSKRLADTKMCLFGLQSERVRATRNPSPDMDAKTDKIDAEIEKLTKNLTPMRLKLAYFRALDESNYDLARQKKHQLKEYEKNASNIVVTTSGWDCQITFSYPSHTTILAALHQQLADKRITMLLINTEMLELTGKQDPLDEKRLKKLDSDLLGADFAARRIKAKIAYCQALDANDFMLAYSQKRKIKAMSRCPDADIVALNQRYKETQTTVDTDRQPKPPRVRFDV